MNDIYPIFDQKWVMGIKPLILQAIVGGNKAWLAWLPYLRVRASDQSRLLPKHRLVGDITLVTPLYSEYE